MKALTKIIFTKHVRKRISEFAEMGLAFKEKDIIAVIEDPEHKDTESDAPKIISSKSYDKEHILRVVFKIEDGIITVITLYPTKVGRYYEN